MKLIKRYLAWRDRHVLKYIGKHMVNVNLQSDGATMERVSVSVLFFMSESGKRKIEWPGRITGYADLNGIMQQKNYGQRIIDWEKGGEFPDGFIPVTDTLGPMLMRMVDKALIGGDE